jgi:uncharacterized membrane protein YdjX (TVP38/TMEM64 family)
MSTAEAKSGPPSLRRALLLLPVAVAVIAFFALGCGRYATPEALAEHREWLLAEVARLGFTAYVLFVALYVLLVAVSIPGAAFLTIVGGFVFGTVIGAIGTVLGATIGATAIFLLARTAIGEGLRARAGPFVQRLEAGFRKNALSYLLFLRLVPGFPFFVVNLVPAFLGVSLRVFVLGTVLGIIPGTIIFSAVGDGLGAVFARGGKADLNEIATDPKVWLPLAGLALLSLLPVAYKRWRGRGAGY